MLILGIIIEQPNNRIEKIAQKKTSQYMKKKTLSGLQALSL
jgi:hypothetical protein